MFMINSFFLSGRACIKSFMGPSEICSADLNLFPLCFVFPVHSLYPSVSGDHVDLLDSSSYWAVCESV
jgi:hypothetical protein